MRCPGCGASAVGNFCSWCGQPLPERVGVDYPYGLRFRGGSPLAWRLAVEAPAYREHEGWHEALYDRSRVRYLLELLKALRGREVLHTIDGKDWSGEWVPWACFAARLDGDPKGWRSVHWGAKCDSAWGCVLAQERQDPYLHARKGEIFWHGQHGRFDLKPEREAWIKDNTRPANFRRWLEEVQWTFHHAVARNEVLRLIRKRHGHRCPMFAVSYLNRAIRRLPDRVVVAEFPERYEVVMTPGTRVGVLWRCYEEQDLVTTLTERVLLPGKG